MRRHILVLSLCLLSASSLLATPARAVEVEKQPTGLGKVQLGMSPEQVAKIYAKDKPKNLTQENIGATPVFSADILRQVVSDQKVPELAQPTTIELRYWKNKLWVIIVYYGSNSTESVNDGLLKQFGKPTVSSTDIVWQFPKVTVNTANREKWYAIADTALSKEAQAAFSEDMRKAAEQRQTQPAPAAAPPKAPAPAGK